MVPLFNRLVLLTALLLGLPLAGIWLAGGPVGRYMEFPPLTCYVEHASFSWLLFILLAIFIGMICLAGLAALGRDGPVVGLPHHRAARPYPAWGVTGLTLTGAAWVLAWNRFPWFVPLQAYTFLPLWLGYIVAINGLSYHRRGRCLLVDEPGFFLLLFPASALFWWFFEYLNRFVQNWHYLGVEAFTPLGYVVHASLCFSTVLPAVLSTEEYLAGCPRLAVPLAAGWRLHITSATARRGGWLLLIAAGSGLAGIGILPDYLFPLVWIAPLLVITSLQGIMGEESIFAPLRDGDWRPVWLSALAALICGFFWEMWNYKSLAHWEYSVPFVQRFHIFEMPLLGYAGYLPFGLECAAVAGLLRRAIGTDN